MPGARARPTCSCVLVRAIGWKGGIAISLTNLASLAYLQGDYNALSPLNEECLALWRELGDRRRMAEIRPREGILAVEQGDFPRPRPPLPPPCRGLGCG